MEVVHVIMAAYFLSFLIFSIKHSNIFCCFKIYIISLLKNMTVVEIASLKTNTVTSLMFKKVSQWSLSFNACE